MTSKAEQAVIRAKASREKATKQWKDTSSLATRVRAQVFAAEAYWLAADSLVVAAEAKLAEHPLFDLIHYYGEQTDELARKAAKCGAQGLPDETQSYLNIIKSLHRELKKFADIPAERVKIIDRIAVWFCIWQKAQSLDYPDIFVNGRGYDEKDAIQYVRDTIKKHLDSKEEASK